MAKWTEINGERYTMGKVDGQFVVRKYGKPRELMCLDEAEVMEKVLRDGRSFTKSRKPIDHPEFSW